MLRIFWMIAVCSEALAGARWPGRVVPRDSRQGPARAGDTSRGAEGERFARRGQPETQVRCGLAYDDSVEVLPRLRLCSHGLDLFSWLRFTLVLVCCPGT